MAWKVEGSCFIQAGGKAVAGDLATGGVAAPAAGGHPLPPIAGCVGVDGDQANVALAKFLAPGVDAVVEIFGIFYSFPLAMTIEQEGNEVVFFLLSFSPTSHTTARAVPPKSILELQVHFIYRIFQFILLD